MVYGRMNRFISGWALRANTLGIVNLVLATCLNPKPKYLQR